LRKLAPRVGIAAATLLLVGCGNFVAGTGVYYNSGLSDASNSMLLANIVRAAKGYPTYYSAVGEYSASQSTSSSLDVNADIESKDGPGTSLGLGSVSVGVGPSVSVDRNANASSLETQDFIRGMHTRIAPELFSLLVESGRAIDLNLRLTLLVEALAITQAEYQSILSGAHSACGGESGRRPVCAAFAEARADAQCVVTPSAAGAFLSITSLRNNPSNPCEYARFRLFIEALILNEPRLLQNEHGDPVVTIGSAKGGTPLFGPEGTGFLLRSPSGVVNYLGEIVREAYSTGRVPRLTTPGGHSIPIFVVNSGGGSGRAAVTARVDGQDYWIIRQELGAIRSDFSNTALAVVKDLQALNTLQNQLPKSPSILIGR
jgi:hypothetical protein